MLGESANMTGQARPLFFNKTRCLKEISQFFQLKWTLIFPMVLGWVCISLVVSQVRPLRLTFILSASIPIMVAMQLPKAAATRSVGEKVHLDLCYLWGHR